MAVRRRLDREKAIITSNAQRRECPFPIDIAQPAAHMRVYGTIIVFGMHRSDTTRDGRYPVLSEAGADGHAIAEIKVGLDGRMIDIGEVARVFARAAKQTGADIFDTQRDARVSGDSRGLAHGFD